MSGPNRRVLGMLARLSLGPYLLLPAVGVTVALERLQLLVATIWSELIAVTMLLNDVRIASVTCRGTRKHVYACMYVSAKGGGGFGS